MPSLTITSPAAGSRVISPVIVNVGFLAPEGFDPLALAGWSVCLSGEGGASERCVALRLDGSATILPELELPPADRPQRIAAWLRDHEGQAVPASLVAVEVIVVTSRRAEMVRWGFETGHVFKEAGPGAWSGAVEAADEAAAKAFGERMCQQGSKGPLRLLVFSNCTSFRTGRAMAHYAEALGRLGCAAHVGVIGDPTARADGQSSYYDRKGRGTVAGQGTTAQVVADQGSSAAGYAPELVFFASWEALAGAAAGPGGYDAVLVEKTGADGDRRPSEAQLAALQRAGVASVVLGIFANWSPHGTVFAPLSSCTEVGAQGPGMAL